MHSSLLSLRSLAISFIVLSLVQGHSWVEELVVIGPDGVFIGEPGYARGNVRRNAPGFSDPTMVNLIPPNGRANQVLDSDLMCRASQATPNQSAGSPALKAAPGSMIALRYQENGHVTLPQNTPGKADNRGSVYIYGTTDPQPSDTLLKIHHVWTADGSGGDKRGKLLATQSFDDGQCYQINGGAISKQRQAQFAHPTSPLMGADLWCQNDIKLPAEAVAGKLYTLYWVWDWPTAANVDAGLPKGKAEIYTTCMDVDVTDAVPAAPSSSNKIALVSHEQAAAPAAPQGKDIANAAIPSLVSQMQQPTSSGSGSGSSAPATTSSSLSTTSSSLLSSSSTSVPSTCACTATATATATVTVTTTATAVLYPIGTCIPPAAAHTTTSTTTMALSRRAVQATPEPETDDTALAGVRSARFRM
ncbi:MAG: hypothetical protein M1826_000200 [Phylliscum demangeonii]|nr:MAG: hypothetical protein M1826_000200 [Phylliscum demangeonii]